MTEVIYKICYFNSEKESRKQVEKEIKEKIDEILKSNPDVVGYDITKFSVDGNSNEIDFGNIKYSRSRRFQLNPNTKK